MHEDVRRTTMPADRPQSGIDEHPVVHRVDEGAVRMALDRLGLADRTLNVYRATAFLTALGITVSRDGAPDATPWSERDGDPDRTVGDVANLIEVQRWLREPDHTMTVEEFRDRPRPQRTPTSH